MHIFDLHEDISTYFLNGYEVKDFGLNDPNRPVDLPKYKKANVKYVVGAVFSGKRFLKPKNGMFGTSFRDAFTETWDQIAFYHRLTNRYSNELHLISSGRDLRELLKTNKIGLIIGIEGAYPLDNPWDLELYYKLGVRVLGLTWNVDNKYAASCKTAKDYGLTGLGEKLVDLASELGVIIDLAHASKRTSLDVLSITEKPVIISHAGVKAVYNTDRNVDDEVLEALRSNKGVMGIFLYTGALSGNEVNIDTVVKHILYVYENFGVDILALGTDYLGIQTAPKGLESIDKITHLVNKLKNAGLTSKDLEKVFYRNALRVFSKCLRNQ